MRYIKLYRKYKITLLKKLKIALFMNENEFLKII